MWFGKQFLGRIREISVEKVIRLVYAPSGKCWIVLNFTSEASLRLITAIICPPFFTDYLFPKNEPATVYEFRHRRIIYFWNS